MCVASLDDGHWWSNNSHNQEAPRNVTVGAARDVTVDSSTVSTFWEPGGRLNKKDGLTRYGNSHVKDKTS